MFRNYLTVVFRSLLRQKWYFVMNITGLAIGMACSILILLYGQ
jgi:putative ABC transport system permease protein